MSDRKNSTTFATSEASPFRLIAMKSNGSSVPLIAADCRNMGVSIGPLQMVRHLGLALSSGAIDDLRAKAIYSDLSWAELFGRRFCQSNDAMLRRAIRAVVPLTELARYTCSVDHCAAVLHMGNLSAHAVEHAFQIDAKD
jgi:hypothetical protein